MLLTEKPKEKMKKKRKVRSMEVGICFGKFGSEFRKCFSIDFGFRSDLAVEVSIFGIYGRDWVF